MKKKISKKVFLGVFIVFTLFATSQVYAMHIMEGFLPKGWALFWYVAAVPFFVVGLRKLTKILKENPNKKLLIALAGAFVFLLSALKIPSVTGSCSHPTGVGLGAIMFGPTIMTVLGVIVLLFQALLLAHGGITTLGANTFSMAIVGPLVSFGLFAILKKTNVNRNISVFLAAALGDLCTYVVTSLQLGLAFPDPVGGFGLSAVKFLGIFALTQVPIAIAEGLITVLVYNKVVEYSEEGVLNEGIN